MKSNLKTRRGLTLLELIVALGLMSLVITLIFSFVNTTQKKSRELDVRQDLQFEGTLVTESMMSNILEMRGINELDGYIGGSDNGEIIAIVFDLLNAGEYEKTDYNNVTKIAYGSGTNANELELWAHHTQKIDTENPTSPMTDWYKINTVTKNLKEISIENERIKTFIKNGVSTTHGKSFEEDLKIQVAKEKSVSLKLILEEDYYGEKIEHEHTIELSLRNAR
ncbi:PilW family protein [uncultured Clostridium sp.]|uniref:PilW family protein n=1 Tax=uncultured Clostridium sp. TaxID=59620 RepID=UPI00261712D5|nr:prepilin-type N-terminal cleavage/methylation domain-containing protein [uncultured Clostridium sp.]